MSNILTTTGIFQNGVVIPKTRPNFDIHKISLIFWPKTKNKQALRKQALTKLVQANLEISADWTENKRQLDDLHNPF